MSDFEQNSNFQASNSKQIPRTEVPNSKQYDLDQRTFKFAEDTRGYIKSIPKTLTNIEYSKQLVRSSASVGANYIEANESLSKKDFIIRLKIARKECKESGYWLRLTEPEGVLQRMKEGLIQESGELLRILSAIIAKSE